ncbi:MAG: hypothetical protein IJG97_02370 [Bacilli bacterium]|nr:hypothetical protein [Bacilli bacterium]
MNKPKLFKNENVKVNNNREACLLKNINNNDQNFEKVFDSIFNSFSNMYNTEVIVETKNKTYKTYLVARTNNNIMTINREIIPIKEIINIRIK